jgi:hypothetical protein
MSAVVCFGCRREIGLNGRRHTCDKLITREVREATQLAEQMYLVRLIRRAGEAHGVYDPATGWIGEERPS